MSNNCKYDKGVYVNINARCIMFFSRNYADKSLRIAIRTLTQDDAQKTVVLHEETFKKVVKAYEDYKKGA